MFESRHARVGEIVVLASFAIAGIIALLLSRKPTIGDAAGDLEIVRRMQWREFKGLLKEVFNRSNYIVREEDDPGPEGGVDFVLRRGGETTVVQCRQWKTQQVDVAPIKRLQGLMMAENGSGAMYVSTGIFAPDVQRFAKKANIQLIDGPTLIKMLHTVRPDLHYAAATLKSDTAPAQEPLKTAYKHAGAAIAQAASFTFSNLNTPTSEEPEQATMRIPTINESADELLAKTGGPGPARQQKTAASAAPAARPAQQAQPAQPSPGCPTCGGGMVRRIAQRGEQRVILWVCKRYPNCNGTRNAEPAGKK